MSSVLSVAWFVLRREFSPPISVLLQWATFCLQLLVYGALISRLVTSIPDYWNFYAVGYVIILSFDVASIAGTRFIEHAHSGRLPYLLSLPLPRWKLYAAIALQGGIWLAVTVSLPLAVTFAIIGNLSVTSITAALLTLFLLGFASAGLMLALSFVAVKSTDAYFAVIAGVNTVSIRFSTVLYPLVALPVAYALVAFFSPLTYGSDLMRLFLGVSVDSVLVPWQEVVVLLLLVLGTMGLGIFLLEHLVEGVKSG